MDPRADLEMEQLLKEVIPALPRPVRNFFAQGRMIPIVLDLVTKYRMRVDQAGVLEREVMMLLMGLETSTEFTSALENEAKLPADIIKKISIDLNTQIFIPLREEMEHGGGEAAAVAPEEVPAPFAPAPQAPVEEKLTMPEGMVPVQEPVAAVPAPDLPPTPPAQPTQVSLPKYIPVYQPGVYAPPPQSPSYQHQEDTTAYLHHVTPVLHRAEMKPIKPSSPLKPAQPAQVKSEVKPAAVTDAAHLLEDHEEPSPRFIHNDAVEAVQKAREASALSQTQAALPVGEADVPPNLPGAPVEPEPEMKPQLARPAFGPLSKPTAASFPTPPAKPYSVDPYREPVDEVK